MEIGRRGFLKLMGVSSSVVAFNALPSPIDKVPDIPKDAHGFIVNPVGEIKLVITGDRGRESYTLSWICDVPNEKGEILTVDWSQYAKIRTGQPPRHETNFVLVNNVCKLVINSMEKLRVDILANTMVLDKFYKGKEIIIK